MRNKVRNVIVGIMLACVLQPAWSQPTTGLHVGDQVSRADIDALAIAAGGQDWKGKLLILDFFATWCAPCVRALDHYDTLMRERSHQLAVVLLTREHREKMEKWSRARSLSFPWVAGANRFHALFPHRSIPHLVLLAADGRVLAITDQDGISIGAIDSILAGQTVAIRRKADDMQFSRFEPLHLPAGSYRYRSVFGGYRPGIGSGAIMQPSLLYDTTGRSRFLAYNLDAVQLYYYAFSKMNGTTINPHLLQVEANDPVIDLKGRPATAGGNGVKSYGEWSSEHLFCYELIMGKATPDSIFFDYVLADLNRQFDFVGKVEITLSPAWIIDHNSNGQLPLAAKGVNPMISFRGDTLAFVGQPLAVVADFLNWHLNDLPVVAAATVADQRVSIDIYPYTPVLTAENVISSLCKAGLRMTRTTAPVSRLVLRPR